MVWPRFGVWLTRLAFVGLAAQPLLFIVIAVPVAASRLLQTGQWPWWQWFIVYAALGGLAQVLATPSTLPLIGLSAPTYPELEALHQLAHWPSLGERVGWWVGTALLGFVILLASQTFFQTVSPEGIAWMLLLGLLIEVSLGLAQYVSGIERVSGWTVNPNVYGVSAVVVAALIVLLGNDRQRLFAGLLATAAVFLSASRAAFLALGALMGVLSAKGARWLRGALALVALATLITLLTQPQWLGRIGADLTLDHITTLSRMEIWTVALQAFRENPLAGIGLHQFKSYYLEHQPPNALDPFASHAHNLWLALLAETGILGTLAFGLLWGMIVVWLIRQRAWFTLALVALVFGINLLDAPFFSAEVYYVLWTAIGWQLYSGQLLVRVGRV